MKIYPIPIFVFGSARSGTTWLANILACHSDVAAATATEHHGIHESQVYSYTRYCFPELVKCIQFFEKYRLEDYHRILETDIDYFCKDKIGLYKVVKIFRLMMDDYAIRHGCNFWLEKSPKHTLYFREIANDFPDAKFVVIKRDFIDTVKSNLMKYPRKNGSRVRQLAEKVFRYESDMKALYYLENEYADRVCVIRYSDLVYNYEKTVNAILGHIGLNKQPLSSEYSSDSSFAKDKKKPSFSMADHVVLLSCRLLVRCMPFWLVFRWRARHDRKMAIGLPRSTRLKLQPEKKIKSG